jgi:four helix bundle protein
MFGLKRAAEDLKRTSETSVRANYRAACRARSRAEFAAKVAIAVEEVDETLYWLELLEESGLLREVPARLLICEAGELVAILAASYKTASASPASRTKS